MRIRVSQDFYKKLYIRKQTIHSILVLGVNRVVIFMLSNYSLDHYRTLSHAPISIPYPYEVILGVGN